MRIGIYNRNKVYDYAKKWAFSRNPAYYNFDLIGGDCTNFASQCIFAGSNIMNYSLNNGWYYSNANSKSPSWTGVDFLYNFLVTNTSVGPFGMLVDFSETILGDLVQLSFDGYTFSHSLIIVKKGNDFFSTSIASHTSDSFNKSLSEYIFKDIRFVHVKGVRFWK